ncbi:MAG: penicillin-binding protein 2 [Actinomycetia bacterium]|nr:penicillin-binding protein 2 [Actinomycetes bacterium]
MLDKANSRRALAVGLALGAAFLAVTARLWQLQIVDRSHYVALAEQDYLRSVPVPAPRGDIVSSDGVVLAGNKPAWELEYLNPQAGPLPAKEAEAVARLLGTTPAQLARTVHREERLQLPYWPVVLDPAQPLTPAQITRYEENRQAFPDLHLVEVPVRSYPFGAMMGDILGYVDLISQQELSQYADQGYRPTSLFGQDGLEREYQAYLRGQEGQQLVEVDRQGDFVRIYGSKPAVPGDTLHLTVDAHLEEVATAALAYVMHAMQTTTGPAHSAGATQGAVIVLDPETGAIRAMAVVPSYNPNQLLPPVSQKTIDQITAAHEWTDLAIAGQFAPGSIFKPIIASGALASGVVTPSTQIFDPGYFPPLPTFKNWNPRGFGSVDMAKALAVSDDTYFYWVGYWMGIQRMDHYIQLYGLDGKTGIDLPGERASQMPTPAAYQRLYGTPWTWGQNLNAAIGQGISFYTLIGLARAEAAVANGGTLYQPHLVARITAPDGRVVKVFRPVVQGRTGIPASVYQVIHLGMEESAQLPFGTGYEAMAGIPLPVATKTGTAQKGAGQVNDAFFTSFAPANPYNQPGPPPTPRLEVLVYIKDGVFGAYSGFVARAIYDQYFHLADPAAKAVFDSVYGGNFDWPFGWTGKPWQPSGPLP